MKHPRNVWCAEISTGSTTVVEGAAGTGKTTALDEAAATGESLGYRVLRAHGNELDRPLPFGVVAQLFEPVLDSGLDVPADALSALRMNATADFAVLHAVYRLAVRLAGEGGLLVVVDDVHWADAPSLRWLAYLAVRLRRQPISLVVSLAADLRCDDPSFAEVMNSGQLVRLGDLDAAEAGHLVADVYGTAVDPTFVVACLGAGGGNPHVISRLAGAVRDGGLPPAPASVYEVAEEVRAEVVLTRLRRRTPAVLTAAQCLAVLGPDPHPAVLAELTGLNTAELAEALRALDDIGVPGVLPFVLQDMPAHARGSLHLRAACALRSHGASATEIARHLVEAPHGTEPWALRMLGIAELVSGQPGAVDRLRSAFAADPGPATAIPLSWALHAAREPAELMSVLTAAPVPDHQLLHAFGYVEAVPAEVPVSGSPAAVLYRAAVGTVDATTAAALTLSSQGTDTLDCLAAATTLSISDHEDDALALLDKVIAREHTPVLRGLAFLMRANAHRRKGALLLAGADAALTFPLLDNDKRWPSVTAMHTLLQVDLLMEDNRSDEADALLSTVDWSSPTWSTASLLAARGRVNIVRGDPRAALQYFLAARDHAERWPFRNSSLLPWRAGAALACAALGDGSRARLFADEEIAHARDWGSARTLGMTLRAAGRVNSGAAGRALLESAVVVLRASSARLELARALTDLGVVLRRQGDTSGARSQLREGLDLAQKCGSAALSARAYAELVATRSSPRKLRQTGPNALTPTEHQVANLAARGQSNEEIATTLLVPANAVEGLLSGAFRKLGVSGRRQLHQVLDVAD